MKFTKILSIVTSIAMSFCMISTPSVNAEESEEKIYTLSELFEMSDEEFLELDDNGYYDSIKFDYDKNVDLVTCRAKKYIWENEDGTPNYIPNITEKEIDMLLGDTIEYWIFSPINIDVDDLRYDSGFSISFSVYDEGSDELTDEDLIELAKCCYCVNQVTSVNYYHMMTDMTGPGSAILSGDVNVDKTVDLYDAIWIASDLAGVFDFTDGQRLIGDVNEDGECNLYDAVEIAKTLMP